MRWVAAAVGMLLAGGVWAQDQGAVRMSLHHARFGAAAVADGDFIYVIAGHQERPPQGTIERIDTRDGSSTVLPVRLRPRRYHSAVRDGRRVHIFGGEDSFGTSVETEILDLDTLQVSRGAPFRTARRMTTAVAHGSDVYVIGGQVRGEEDRSNLVEVLNLRSGRWTSAPNLPEGKETTAVLHRGRIYTLGGYRFGTTGERSCEEFDPATGRWRILRPAPFPLSAHRAVSMDDAIVCFGDYAELGRVAAYLPGRQEWRVLDVRFTPRRHAALAVSGESVWVIGGIVATHGPFLRTIERYRLAELRRAIAAARPVME